MAQSASISCSVLCHKPLLVIYEGEMKKTYEGDKEYAAFLGIPYAKIPEGLKRNQAPESVTFAQLSKLSDPTKGKLIPTYRANVTGKKSTQMEEPFFEGSADCLYLNIFVPDRPELIDELLPVLVYIHGGGFTFGSGDPEMYTPDSILQHGVVFVTINYRLGLFGFMNTHSKKCPGNAGLKDQVKALEWIRDNIEYFKGDPKNVTISGCSAGGTCVNLHLIAPASKDLFHKAIVQSGGVFSSWGYRGHQSRLSKMLLDDPVFQGLFFAEQESKELQEWTGYLLQADRLKRHPQSYAPLFGPSVEQYEKEAFITEDIREMMKKVDHDKPVMAGITKEEGIYQFCVDGFTNFIDWINKEHSFRQILMDNFRWSSETAERHVDEIRNKYFPRRLSMSAQERERCYAKFVRDIYFRRFYDNFKFGPEGAVHKNLYVYRFDHVSEISLVERRCIENFNGATHGDELKYLYPPTSLKRNYGKYIYDGPKQNKTIQMVMNHICSLWANFCKTGIPKSDFDSNKVEWRRHTEEKPCYLSISKDLTLREGSLFKEEWDWLNACVNSEPTIESSPEITPDEDE